MENEIVKNYKGDERAGTFLIAEGFQRRHNQVVKHIKDYYKIFISMEKSFARIDVKVPQRKIKTKGRGIKEYLLNEQQTIFLIYSFLSY